MKLILTIFISLLIIQEISSQITIKDDNTLSYLNTKIIEDWNINIIEDTLIIESKDNMWIEFYNIAGASVNDAGFNKYTESYLKENGAKTKAKILFRLELKWSKTKIEKVNERNYEINNKIDSLINEYKLSHLKRTFRWNEELFWKTTKEEDNRIILYKLEKEKLLKKIIKIPYYQSEKYSLFVINKNWSANLAYLIPMIFPEEETKKIEKLEVLINGLLT